MKKHNVLTSTVSSQRTSLIRYATRRDAAPVHTHVLAPQLARVLDALLAMERDPTDRRAKVMIGLLDKQGAFDCPACSKRLSLEGYRATRTHYGSREVLACGGCRTSFVVTQSEIV